MDDTEVYIAVGSNEFPEKHINMGLNLLQENVLTDVRISSCYKSHSINGGADYLNLVIRAESRIDSYDELVLRLKEIEKKCGRVKNPYHSCVLDLDLLLFGKQVIKGKLPHEDLYKYLHVLVPFCELAGHEKDLLFNRTYSEILKSMEHSNDDIYLKRFDFIRD